MSRIVNSPKNDKADCIQPSEATLRRSSPATRVGGGQGIGDPSLDPRVRSVAEDCHPERGKRWNVFGVSDRHSVIARRKALCEKAGAAVYSGRNFLDARWEDGKKISLGVDEQVASVTFQRGSVVELKCPVTTLNASIFVSWGADEFSAILQVAGEDENGDICATGEATVVERGQLELFKPTGIVIDLE